MRQRAAESDVVIVNHHLLCADAAVRQSAFGEVIPSCRYADRRRGAPARGRRHAVLRHRGQQLPRRRLRARRGPRGRARSRSPTATRPTICATTSTACATTRARSSRPLQMLRFDGTGAGGAESRIRVTARRCSTARADDAGGAGPRARGARSDDRAAPRTSPEDVARARRAAPRSCGTDVDVPDSAPTTAGYVYYLEIRGRGVFLRASPIDVSDIVRELLLDRMTATVLTSATLTVDGSFDYVRGRLGIRQAHEVAAAVGVRLRAAGDPVSAEAACPTRGRREFVDGGRRARWSRSSSARAAARSCCSRATRTCAQVHAARRRPRSTYPILVQGTAPRSALLRDFKATPNAVLLRHVQLLAGRRRRRRGAELRDHRQAAVRLARRSDYVGAHRGHQRARRHRPSANTRSRSRSWRSSRDWAG